MRIDIPLLSFLMLVAILVIVVIIAVHVNAF
jgi:hypothetical protein